ncbi:MAG: LCP family protein [Clostridium sp.]|nr:LCP family protein [Clostridium sp.]
MSKPIDPNLDGDSQFDILNSLDEPEVDSAAEEKIDLMLSEKNYSKRSSRHHSHSSGTHHHSSHSSGSGHHSSHSSGHSRKKKMPIAAKLAIAFLVIILVLVLAVAGTFMFLQNKGKSDMTNVTTQTNYDEVIEHNGHKYVYNEDVVSIAFIGVDKRDINEESTIGTAGQADADVILTVDTSTGRAKAIAIPRDTMVDVDLYSENGVFLRSEEMQLCLSFAYGDGKATSAENVTTSISRILYDVPVNKYFAMDLNGIAPINDAIGGVTVTSLYDFPKEGIYTGDVVKLTGEVTEQYVRHREIDTVDASLNRTARQVQYIKAFASQLVPAVISDFSIISNLYNTASKYSTTNMSLSNVTYLASLLVSKGIRDFETETLQGEMKTSDKVDYEGFVYAEFYPDEDALLETVLDTFYTQVD